MSDKSETQTQTLFNNIMSKGKTINSNLNEKIKKLDTLNTDFKTTLTGKLQEIIGKINEFKNTNLQGLTETKSKLSQVTEELNKTKAELDKTKEELKKIQEGLKTANELLEGCSKSKTILEQQIKDLEAKQQAMQAEYDKKSEADKQTMLQEFQNQKQTMEAEKNELKKQMEEAQSEQTQAIQNLTALQEEHQKLVVSLGTINDFLDEQSQLIDKINIDQPNSGDYTSLLDTIQTGLSGVIGEINNAVTSSPEQKPNSSSSSSSSQTPLADRFFNKYKNLDTNKRNDLINKLQLRPNEKQILNSRLRNFNDNKELINNTLLQIKDIDQILSEYEVKGGKRRRKTMRRKPRKTFKRRKVYRGGYVYSTNKKLDSASSVVSSSEPISRTRSKMKKKYKTKRKASTK
jgi:uncharacterized phage infection (PIP) family protein YhgE